MRAFAEIHGVDFSGAKRAGRFLWWATLRQHRQAWHLVRLTSLEHQTGTPDRDAVLPHLREAIRASDQALWALDFSFSLPCALLGPVPHWHEVFALVATPDDDALTFGRTCRQRALASGQPGLLLRQTERENHTPLAAYHYRLVYQTFFGIREILAPLREDPATAIVPFQYDRVPTARRVLVEALPAASLRRWGLPYRGYKQPEGKAPCVQREAVRQQIVDFLCQWIDISSEQQATMIQNPGGDALDAVIAAWGAHQAWDAADHSALAAEDVYRIEGREFP
jgi:hypothetical protein